MESESDGSLGWEPGGSLEGSLKAPASTFNGATAGVTCSVLPAAGPQPLPARVEEEFGSVDGQQHDQSPDPSTSDPDPEKAVVDGEKGLALDRSTSEAYPEGGLQAWLVVFGSFSGLLAALGIMNSIGVYQAYLAEHQLAAYSQSSIGWISGVYAFFCFFGGVQVGPIFDAKGPRLLVVIGSCMMVISTFTMGICTQYWQFMLVTGVVGGLGTSMVFTPSISAIGHWFKVRRGYATGVAISAGGIGGVILPLMLQRLFATAGFAWATRALGFIQLALLILACALIRSRLPPKPGGSILPDPTIFRDPAFAFTTLGVWMLEWGLFIPLAFLPSYGIATGAMSSAFAYQLMSIFNAGSFLGRWLPGLVADRIGRYNCSVVALLGCAVSAFAFWAPAAALTAQGALSSGSTVGLSVAFAAIMGFFSGSNLSLTPVCVGQLCNTNEYGRYYSTCYTVASFGTLTGIPIGGAIVAACGGQYWGLALFCGSCYILSAFGFAAARVTNVGWKLRTIY